MYEIKNTTTDIVAVFDSKNNRIEIKPGEQIEIDRPINGQGIITCGGSDSQPSPVEQKSKSKKKYEEVI